MGEYMFRNAIAEIENQLSYIYRYLSKMINLLFLYLFITYSTIRFLSSHSYYTIVAEKNGYVANLRQESF